MMADPPKADGQPTEAEIDTHVAESCIDLAQLCQSERFRTVRYLLGLVRVEAEKLQQA